MADKRTLLRAFFTGRVLEQREAEAVADVIADRSDYRPVHITKNGMTSVPEDEGLFEEADTIADQRQRALSEPLLTWLSHRTGEQRHTAVDEFRTLPACCPTQRAVRLHLPPTRP
ncbi:hypothetical protein [Nocardia sp. CNY236]|uniref:hypothetical protein n=1 Tax=Nocardia sp. CNY236 TaxID=1169152 RepID=UPI0012DE8C5F|nr:hypothetical protein [Nocardia sp. CNY236]